jgi:glycosyltransferase involved in cell wall biosynthesis
MKKLSRVVFAYDGGFARAPDGKVYSQGGFPAENWGRYLEFAEELIVTARMHDAESASGVLSSRDRVSFVRVPSISSPTRALTNRPLAREILEREIGQANHLIVRLPSEIGLLAIRIARSLGKPFSIELVGDPLTALAHHKKLYAKLYAPLLSWRTRRAISTSRACIYVTRKTLQELYPCPGICASASNVNITLSPWPEVQDRVREKIRQPRKSFALIGSMVTDYKGVDIAIKALNLLVRQGLDCELRILGSGDHRHLEELARTLGVAENVHFDGTRNSSTEVLGWLDLQTFYLQPSRSEGLPRSLIEAMSRGIPAAGSDRGGIPELLPEEFIFSNLEHAALGSIMKRMLELSPDEYMRECRRAYQTASTYERNKLDETRHNFWKTSLSS